MRVETVTMHENTCARVIYKIKTTAVKLIVSEWIPNIFKVSSIYRVHKMLLLRRSNKNREIMQNFREFGIHATFNGSKYKKVFP